MAFGLAALFAGLVTIPAIGAPAGPTWTGVAVIVVLVVVFLLQLQPISIGILDGNMTIRWPLRRKVVPLSSIAEYRFIIDRRYVGQDWTRRYYSLHLHLTSERRILVGGLDGPAARKLMTLVPPLESKVLVYSGNRLLEERGVESSSR